MTIDDLMHDAGRESIDTREAYLVMFTEGFNGYVCRNEGATDENRALFKGTYRDCQIWIERRGLAAALRYVAAHIGEVVELTTDEPHGRAKLLEALSRLPAEGGER
jgi:hypothetical protein